MEQHHLIYKIASEPEEMEQIYRLNYETFVEEIPQHEENERRCLVDKFDQENNYIIAKHGENVIGMIAARAQRPFSLDYKLDNLDDYLPPDANPCEIRLLSVKKEYRKTWVFYQLVKELVNYCIEKNYNMALISGTDRQIKLYKKIGFEPFGPMVGKKDAMFQPMYLTKERFSTTSKAFAKIMQRKNKRLKKSNFLPGPVAIAKEVEEAFRKEAISHRWHDFMQEMKAVQSKLCELVHARYGQIIVGTGTLANDLVAAQIKKLSGKGLILANGEFGYRLINHGERFSLPFYTLEKQWNEHISLEEIEKFLQNHRDITWVWTVHCETSTGYLFDLPEILALCKKYSLKLCVDACSSVGVVPVDFHDIYLASTVSGKGLASYPGLAIVFHQEPIEPSRDIPRYLDLGQYMSAGSVPYTHSSNLISALHEAVKKVDVQQTALLADAVRKLLSDLQLKVLGNENYSPGIITIPIPAQFSSRKIGDLLKEKGMITSYESEYLLQRNWIQFAIMGDHQVAEYEEAFSILKQVFDWKEEQVHSNVAN